MLEERTFKNTPIRHMQQQFGDTRSKQGTSLGCGTWTEVQNEDGAKMVSASQVSSILFGDATVPNIE